MGEEPEQVLPQQRVAAARHLQDLAARVEAARQEKTGPSEAVHQLQDAGRFERREREQQQERSHELRPDEERHPHEAEASGPNCTIVTMKFTEPSSEDVIRNTMPN